MIDVAADLDADAGAVWSALVDTTRWPAWGPTVAGATVDGGGDRIGPGATGRVRTAVGVWLPFAVTAWDPGRRWAWSVAGIGATAHRVEPRPGGCRAVIEVPVWAAPYVGVCRLGVWRLGREARRG